ncbi:MAG: RNA pyrophosphohydrolase [bacterium]|nr:RNA pyrophosphohydrolase [bacterium]
MQTVTDRSHLPYRPCVGILMFDADGRVFVAQRIGMPGAWQMPQGGIDEGEDPRSAALRELSEEIGTAAVEIVGETPEWITYDFPPELEGRIRDRWRGQSQKWFACRFVGTDADVNLVTEHPEFDAWKWVAMDEVVDLIVAFKRRSYQEVVEALAPVVATATGTAVD